MEFCPELAVLHGSFTLIKSQGIDLETCEPPCSVDVIRPVIETIGEIIAGLEYPHSGPEKQFWAWKLCAILLAKTLSNNDVKAKKLDNKEEVCSSGLRGHGGAEEGEKDEEEEEWCDVLEECLPRLSMDVYYELVKACHWEEILCEILSELREDIQMKLMSTFLSRLSQYGGNRDAEILHAICKFSVKHSALLLSAKKTVKSTEFKDKVNGTRHQKKLVANDTEDMNVPVQHDYKLCEWPYKLTTLKRLLNTCQIMLECSLIDEQKRDMFLCLMAVAMETVHVLSSVRSEELGTQSTVHDLWDSLKLFMGDILAFLNHCIQTETHFRSLFYKFDLDPQSENVTIDCVFITLEQFEASLNLALQTEEFSCMQNFLETLLKSVSPVHADISVKYREELKRREPTPKEKLVEAELRVNERKAGWEDWLLWLLDAKEITSGLEDRWLDCLEDNVDAMAKVEYIHKLLGLLDSGQGSQGGQMTSRLEKLVLRAYGLLDIVNQNQLFHQFLTSHQWSKDDQFDQTLTSTFNRLTTAGKPGRQVQCEVLALALQSPRDVMEKIIQYAVVNNGQTQLITQLLKSVPVLCQYNLANQSNFPLLENVLLTWLNKPNMTETHRQNMVALLVAAVQEEPSLISPKSCLEHMVVPHLSSVETDPTFALQVFHKVLQYSPSSIFDSNSCDPLTIVVCLCSMIEQCSCSLWDPSDKGNRTVLKQCCLDILQDLAKVLQNQKFLELDVEWLCEQLCNIGWQARLQAEPVLRAITSDTLPKMKYQLKGYTKVISSICHLPADEWSAADVRTDEEMEVSLLKLCAISNTVASAVIEAMDCNTVLSYQCLLSAAIQVLPNCLMSEWSNIMDLVGHLVRSDQVHVQYQTHYMKHLPLVDLTGLKYELSLLQFNSDVMCLLQTLYGFKMHEKSGEGYWFHLNQCCANMLKNIFSSLSHPAASQAFLLSQAVCHVCHLLSVLPALGTESMFVLVLDWLSELQADSVLKHAILYRETVEESIRHIQNEQWSQTLLKKLL